MTDIAEALYGVTADGLRVTYQVVGTDRSLSSWASAYVPDSAEIASGIPERCCSASSR